MSCEGCGLRFTFLKRRKRCDDCGFVFCSSCSESKGKLYQCYRCKVFTCVPLAASDVAGLRLRDLQWFLDARGVPVPTNDRREKPVLVDWVMNYSRQQLYPVLEPTLCPNIGLFGSQSVTGVSSENTSAPNSQPDNISCDSMRENSDISDIKEKHQMIDLKSVNRRDDIFELTTIELKVLLTRNFISFRGCCEKTELQEKVCWLWDLKEAAKNKNVIPDENLCKICMEANIDSLFLDCGHMVTCHNCGKQLHDCPICRQIILRVVRAFKS